ncbi:MAG TPA: peptidoglycan DD-metalloendopeptidase family protein [Spirochaetota bacterium]|nr:peptidoglycan DD-metalloendopeptidase family protein [Spirochaetota bacterium]HOD16074.1 peptidoglycan DD-metalloendopeptidase family protein [Spirochaetota bacterium]HPG52283.1 peptidoglycan DD-metalloendopeptidase family protein [Spirochaetota bacterium]HPN13190.1 peptidoglycan DD-metalloendopeptidase family protein [Spirochaetota bacterium]
MRRACHNAICIAALLVCAGSAYPGPGGIVNEQREKGRESVRGQRDADRERVERIRKEMRNFIDEINGRIGGDSGRRFREPVDIDAIDDIETIDHNHSGKKTAEREYAFVRGERVIIRAEGAVRGREIGFLDYREKVEVLAQTGHADTIKGVSSPWVLVRRSGGDEGWVFGAFLGKTEPQRREDFGTLDRKETGRRFNAPVEGIISSRYGYRVDPKTKKREAFHRGLDIAAPIGTPVKASSGGTVISADFNRNGYGNLVVIEHEKELVTYYGHLDTITVRRGQQVAAGEEIGTVGKTGRTTGPHLHFEVRRGGTAYDPEEFLK